MYTVGIDLGTTHAVVAYAQTADNHGAQVLPIGQWVGAGEWGERLLLPTYRYHFLPHEGDLNQGMPFAYKPVAGDFAEVMFGAYALHLGGQNRGQGVASAKSWLTQAARVQQQATDAFLPLSNNHGSTRQAATSQATTSQSTVKKVSPLTASASFLNYIRHWWNHCFPEARLESQNIVVTLPASFDEYARDLTLRAAEMAGLKQVQLLEEPTAAVYDWLNSSQSNQQAPGFQRLCVIDVGGGTTDLSALDFSEPQQPKRQAVGPHLMLGGDNMDAHVASTAWQALKTTGKVDASAPMTPAQWSQMLLTAQSLKEDLLKTNTLTAETLPFTLLGRGGGLIAQHKSVDLETHSLRSLLIDGFLPIVTADQLKDYSAKQELNVNQSVQPNKTGIVRLGLEYADDPAITNHLARFVQQECAGQLPDGVLVNGGFFNSNIFQDRIFQQFDEWLGKPVIRLVPQKPQLAVALGAVIYGSIRIAQPDKHDNHKPALIQSGAPHSLFLQVTEAEQQQLPQAIELLRRGTPEGKIIQVPHVFHLAVKQAVRFPLFSSTLLTAPAEDGQKLYAIDTHWRPLPPLVTEILPSEATGQNTTAVQLTAEYTAVGAVKIQCFPAALQTINPADAIADLYFSGQQREMLIRNNQLPQRWSHIVHLIEATFGAAQHKSSTSKDAVRELKTSIEKILGAKNTWSLSVCRSLADELLRLSKNRRRSAKHEQLWLNITSFGLRPGRGVVGDTQRMQYALDVLNAPPGNAQEIQVWEAYWTAARRLVGGLTPLQQLHFYQRNKQLLQDTLRLAKTKPSQVGKKTKLYGADSLLKCFASLESLPQFEKNQLASQCHQLLKAQQVYNGVSFACIAWCLAQLCARTQTYVDAENFTPLATDQVEQWLNEWLTFDWQKIPEIGLAAASAADQTTSAGQARSAHQVSHALADAVVQKLKESHSPKAWIELVGANAQANKQDINHSSHHNRTGETLPLGLRLSSP